MKNTILIFILAIVPYLVEAKKAVFGKVFSYKQGNSLEKLEMNKYNNNFSGEGNVLQHLFTLGGFARKKWGFFPEIEGRLNIEHLAYSIDGVVNGKCYAGLGGSILLGGDGFLNAHGGVTYCSARQTSLYVLETTAPKLNPYDSELSKSYYGVATNFEGERSKWGLRLFYDIHEINLRIYHSGNSSSQIIKTQMYGLEIFFK